MQPARKHEAFGRYELITMLARGGMAEVFLARTSGVGGFSKLMVIKRMLPHLSDDPEFVELFLNEGRIAARLSHPNVCQVYDLGEVNGALYLAMEYLDGLAWADFSPLVPLGAGIELQCAAAVLGQISEGLRYAHELRDLDGAPTPIVHRDVSPQNMFVTTTGVCKLLDFGVSKMLTEGTRTRSGTLKGKLPYMAPEQIRGERVDARADVFSLGVVLWEALTGERLFKRDSDYLIWRAITEGEVPPVTSIRPDLPRAIDAVVERALERDRNDRYPSVRDLAVDLESVAAAVGGALSPPALAHLLRSAGEPQLRAQAERVASALMRGDEAAGRAPEADAETVVGHTASDDSSLVMRTRSVKLARAPRRWPRVAIGLVLASSAVVGVTLAATLGSHDHPVAAAIPPADASVSPPPLPVAPQPSPVTPHLSPDAAIVEPPPTPISPPIAKNHHPVAPPRRPGLYSIDSSPYAKIFIDGRSYGDTPLFKASLAAGTHHVRAVRADGKTQQLTVTIEPGKLVSSGTLQW